MPKRSPVASMPLPVRNKDDEDRRKRVDVLLDTVDRWTREGDNYVALAQENMARWEAKNKLTMTRPKLHVVKGDMLETAGKLTQEYGTPFVCLNMANEHYPGGGYTVGCAAQEENMFRRTNAHFTLDETNLVKHGRDVVYTDAMRAMVGGAHGVNYLSEEPLVCLKGKEVYEAEDLGYEALADDEVFPFYELRSAAVNISHLKKPPSDIKAQMAHRIAAQFAALKASGHRHVVLSAFGCGAFGNDPWMVARLYRQALLRHKDDLLVVAFAIFYAGSGKQNHEVFENVLWGVWGTNDPMKDAMIDAARETLAIIQAARPIYNDEMFPDYHDASKLCLEMVASLAKWSDTAFVAKTVEAFRLGDARKGMQLARENVFFYIPFDCDWQYLDERM